MDASHKTGTHSRWQMVAVEFGHHLPFTLVGTLIAMAAVWWFGTQHLAQDRPEQMVEQSLAIARGLVGLGEVPLAERRRRVPHQDLGKDGLADGQALLPSRWTDQ